MRQLADEKKAPMPAEPIELADAKVRIERDGEVVLAVSLDTMRKVGDIIPNKVTFEVTADKKIQAETVNEEIARTSKHLEYLERMKAKTPMIGTPIRALANLDGGVKQETAGNKKGGLRWVIPPKKRTVTGSASETSAAENANQTKRD